MEHGQKIGLTVVGGVIVILVFGLFFNWTCHSEYRQYQVTEVRWEHRTILRERHEETDGGWGSPPRTGGYYQEPTFNESCRTKTHHHNCHPVGKVTICVPVYWRWCDYSYWGWWKIDSQSITELGEEGTSFRTFGNLLDNNHRETQEKYFFVTFSRQGKDWVYATRSYEEYKRYLVGDLWEIEIPRFGGKKPKKKAYLENPQ